MCQQLRRALLPGTSCPQCSQAFRAKNWLISLLRTPHWSIWRLSSLTKRRDSNSNGFLSDTDLISFVSAAFVIWIISKLDNVSMSNMPSTCIEKELVEKTQFATTTLLWTLYFYMCSGGKLKRIRFLRFAVFYVDKISFSIGERKTMSMECQEESIFKVGC